MAGSFDNQRIDPDDPRRVLRTLLDTSGLTQASVLRRMEERHTRAASKPPSERPESFGDTKLSRILNGHGKAPSWQELQAITDAIDELTPGHAATETVCKAFTRWSHRMARPARSFAPAQHFASAAFVAGVSFRRPAPDDFTIGLATAHADPVTPVEYAHVFDQGFQEALVQWQEQKILRPDQHSFETHVTHTLDAISVWGPMIRAGHDSCFVTVTATRHGAVSVFLQQAAPATGWSEELLMRRIHDTWAMTISVHHLLDVTGPLLTSLTCDLTCLINRKKLFTYDRSHWYHLDHTRNRHLIDAPTVELSPDGDISPMHDAYNLASPHLPALRTALDI